MPRYFFHLADGGREPDDQGVELADDQAAQQMAVAFAGEVLQSDPKSLWDHGTWRVEVTDSYNILLFTVITLAVDAPKPGDRDGASRRRPVADGKSRRDGDGSHNIMML